MARGELPAGASISYSRQYRRCGKPGCLVCAPGSPGHGPYWYAYWRQDGRTCSRYLGRETPPGVPTEQPPHAAGQAPHVAAAVQAQSAPLRVRTLGGFAVWHGDEPVPEGCWRRRKVAALFKCLLTAPSYQLHREQVLELLWPEAESGQGAGNLRSTVHRLRRALDGEMATSSHVRYDGEVLALLPAVDAEPPTGWFDAAAFAHAARVALAGRDAAACRLALARYSGDYLPEDPYEEWAVSRREELRGLRLALLLHLAALSAATGDTEEAQECLRTVLAIDRCHEEAALALMRLYAAAGRPMHALRIYRRLAEALRDELDLEPEEEARALYHALAAQRQATPARAAPAEPPMPTNLPAPLTSFIGRRRELAEIVRLLKPNSSAEPPLPAKDEAAPCRLLTLTGPGGCGKTRLALQAADELLEQYPDGIWLVDLAPLTRSAGADNPLVSRAVAAVLGLREESDQPLTATLGAFLRARRLLLLLDNCEHVLEACAALATVLLRAAPALRILATSREALGIAGEQPWPVPPLSLPPKGAATVGQLPRSEAVRLFLDRARVQRPGLGLTEENAAQVVRICRQLDGIPLAIELAAARANVLSVEQIAQRLQQSFALLTAGPRTALPRQKTLRAALDWSHDLLSEPERTLLRRLAVFAGGSTLEAAEIVCAGGEVTTGEVLDLLAGLVRKSLLLMDDQEGGGRYRLLETVRQYAWERLAASGETAALRRQHALVFLSLARQAEQELRGSRQTAWLARLEQEHDNLRAALEWARTEGEAELGLQMAGALWPFWRIRGHLSEGRGWLEDLLRRSSAPTATRAHALNGAGTLARDQGDFGQARDWLEESLALSRVLQDAAGMAAALSSLGTVAKLQGDYAEAAALHEESLALFRELGDTRGIAFALGDLGNVARRQGHYAQAEALQEQSLAIRREVGDKHDIAVSLNNLAMVAYDQGDYARCTVWLEESLEITRELDDREGLATSLGNLGSLLLDQGEFRRAQVLIGEALALKHEVGDKDGIAICLVNLAQIAHSLHQPAHAAHLLGGADALWSAIGAALPPGYQTTFDQLVMTTREALGEATFACLWAAGQRAPLERIVTNALEPATADQQPAS